MDIGQISKMVDNDKSCKSARIESKPPMDRKVKKKGKKKKKKNALPESELVMNSRNLNDTDEIDEYNLKPKMYGHGDNSS